MNFKLIARILAWIGCVALAIASLLPSDAMVRTNLGGLIEHFVAYLLVGFAFTAGYPKERAWHIMAALSAYAVLLEAAQLMVPGRHPGFLDWIVGTAGAASAIAVARLALYPNENESAGG